MDQSVSGSSEAVGRLSRRHSTSFRITRPFVWNPTRLLPSCFLFLSVFFFIILAFFLSVECGFGLLRSHFFSFFFCLKFSLDYFFFTRNLSGFTANHRLFMGFTEFYWVLLGFTGFYWVLLGFTGFCWVLLGFTGFYWVSQGFTGFHRILQGFAGFYRVLLGFTGFYGVTLGFTGFYWVSLGFTGFYWVLLGFTGFYGVTLGFTRFCWLRRSCVGSNRGIIELRRVWLSYFTGFFYVFLSSWMAVTSSTPPPLDVAAIHSTRVGSWPFTERATCFVCFGFHFSFFFLVCLCSVCVCWFSRIVSSLFFTAPNSVSTQWLSASTEWFLVGVCWCSFLSHRAFLSFHSVLEILTDFSIFFL